MQRTKPTREQREATHEAAPSDYQKIGKAVVEAIALKQKNVILKFPYFVRLPDDWPRGLLIKKTSDCNFYKVKTFKAADWLNSKGHLALDSKGIVLSMRTVVNMWNEADRLLDSTQDFCYDDVPVDEPIVLPIDSIFVGQIKEEG